MSNLYFAYGSNMSRARLRARIPAAESLGPACLRGRRLSYNKRGVDGTGKANLVVAAGVLAWGVLYRLRDEDWRALDAFEPGYLRSIVGVYACKSETEIAPARGRSAQIYLAHEVGRAVRPADWYRDHLLAGAREHDLPLAVIRQIECMDRG